MPYDYSKLDGKITEVFGARYNFAKAMGMSERSLSLKMTCQRPWKDTQISKAAQLLGISQLELGLYFFKLKVQANLT